MSGDLGSGRGGADHRRPLPTAWTDRSCDQAHRLPTAADARHARRRLPPARLPGPHLIGARPLTLACTDPAHQAAQPQVTRLAKVTPASRSTSVASDPSRKPLSSAAETRSQEAAGPEAIRSQSAASPQDVRRSLSRTNTSQHCSRRSGRTPWEKVQVSRLRRLEPGLQAGSSHTLIHRLPRLPTCLVSCGYHVA